MDTAREETAVSMGNEAGGRQPTESSVRDDVIKKRSVEDLIGPLNEIERKYAPRQLWVAGDRPYSTVAARSPCLVLHSMK